jgi:hypothetical protein
MDFGGTMNVTMVGVSGSGKTSFMAGLYEVLGTTNINGFHLRPMTNARQPAPKNPNDISEATDATNAIISMGDWNKISFGGQGLNFPRAGTAYTTIWPFDLLHETNLVSSFRWIDYKGGLLEDISSSTSDEKNLVQLLNTIFSSQAVMLFVDSIIITRYDDLDEARYWSGARQLNQIIETYNQHNRQSILTLTIVLTKADAVEEKWKIDDYKTLIHRGLEVFEPIINLCHNNEPRWRGGIVPVSAVGEGRAKTVVTEPETFQEPIKVETQLLAFPKPMNVDHALFFCIGTILEQLSKVTQHKIWDLDQKIKHAQKNPTAPRNLLANFMGESSTSGPADELIQERAREYKALQVYAPHVKNLYSLSLNGVRRI